MPEKIGELVDAGRLVLLLLLHDYEDFLNVPSPQDSTEEIRALQVAVASMLNRGVNKIIVAVSSIVLVEQLLERVSSIDVVIVQGQFYSNEDNPGTRILALARIQRSYVEMTRSLSIQT